MYLKLIGAQSTGLVVVVGVQRSSLVGRGLMGPVEHLQGREGEGGNIVPINY